jgi:hypothetical protein
MVATLEERNTNEAILEPMVGSGESAFKESLETGGRFCIGAFGKNLASVVMKMFHI